MCFIVYIIYQYGSTFLWNKYTFGGIVGYLILSDGVPPGIQVGGWKFKVTSCSTLNSSSGPPSLCLSKWNPALESQGGIEDVMEVQLIEYV